MDAVSASVLLVWVALVVMVVGAWMESLLDEVGEWIDGGAWMASLEDEVSEWIDGDDDEEDRR